MRDLFIDKNPSLSLFFAEECGAALGMESGAIKNEDINASSSHSEVSVGPMTAR